MYYKVELYFTERQDCGDKLFGDFKDPIKGGRELVIWGEADYEEADFSHFIVWAIAPNEPCYMDHAVAAKLAVTHLGV